MISKVFLFFFIIGFLSISTNAYLLGLHKVSPRSRTSTWTGASNTNPVRSSHSEQSEKFTFFQLHRLCTKKLHHFGLSKRTRKHPTVLYYDWNSEFDDEDSFDEEGDPSFDSDEDSVFSFGKSNKETTKSPAPTKSSSSFSPSSTNTNAAKVSGESPTSLSASVVSNAGQLNPENTNRWRGLFRRRSVNLNMSDQSNQNEEGKIFIPEEFKYEARNFSLDMKSNALFSYWAQGILILTAGVVLVFTSSLNQSAFVGNNANLIRKKMANNATTNMYIWNGTLSAALAVLMGIFSFFQAISYSVLSRRILKVIDQNPNPTKPQTFSLMKKLNAKESPTKFIVRKASSALKRGIILNIIGLFFALISAEQFVGSLIGKVLSSQGIQQLYGGGVGVPQTVQPTDIFVIQANTNTLFSHFISLVVTLRLLQRLGRMKQFLIG